MDVIKRGYPEGLARTLLAPHSPQKARASARQRARLSAALGCAILLESASLTASSVTYARPRLLKSSSNCNSIASQGFSELRASA